MHARRLTRSTLYDMANDLGISRFFSLFVFPFYQAKRALDSGIYCCWSSYVGILRVAHELLFL
jgi:hypothetical protein